MTLVFEQGSQSNIKLNAPKNKLSNFVKGKAPIVQNKEGYILYPQNYHEYKIRKIHAGKSCSVSHHVYMLVMRILAMGIQFISKCLRKRLLMHPMSIAFHLKFLVRHLCLLTNQAR
jgi:hypothetical protein